MDKTKNIFLVLFSNMKIRSNINKNKIKGILFPEKIMQIATRAKYISIIELNFFCLFIFW